MTIFYIMVIKPHAERFTQSLITGNSNKASTHKIKQRSLDIWIDAAKLLVPTSYLTFVLTRKLLKITQ